MENNLLTEVVDYLYANYSHEDAKRLSDNKLIANIAMRGADGKDFKSIIDKIALFNNMQKIQEVSN